MLLSIVDWYVTVFGPPSKNEIRLIIVMLPHTSTGPAVHTATDIATPESVAFTLS
jgi:hypothetical protein